MVIKYTKSTFSPIAQKGGGAVKSAYLGGGGLVCGGGVFLASLDLGQLGGGLRLYQGIHGLRLYQGIRGLAAYIKTT